MTNLIFDLVYNKGDINYKINNFPDGQKSITIDDDEVQKLYKSVHVIIITSIENFQDLELVVSAVSALKLHTKNYSLYSPYIVGARSDRKFSVGDGFYFDDVILPILKNCEFKEIITLDNHCKRSILTDIPFWHLTDFYTKKGFGIIFPDKSAHERFSEFDEVDNYVYMNKTRTEDGIIQKPNSAESLKDVLNCKEIIIFDDLFDGGASYINLCRKIKEEHCYPGKITIFVTHLIGSNLVNLVKIRDLGINIFTSNSYNSIYETDNIDVIDLFTKEMIDTVFN